MRKQFSIGPDAGLSLDRAVDLSDPRVKVEISSTKSEHLTDASADPENHLDDVGDVPSPPRPRALLSEPCWHRSPDRFEFRGRDRPTIGWGSTSRSPPWRKVRRARGVRRTARAPGLHRRSDAGAAGDRTG